jgi:hypothetical protein
MDSTRLSTGKNLVMAGLDCAVVINFARERPPSIPASLTAITAVPAVMFSQEML